MLGDCRQEGFTDILEGNGDTGLTLILVLGVAFSNDIF